MMEVLRKLGNWARLMVGTVSGTPHLHVRKPEEILSSLNVRRTKTIVKDDRARISAAEEKRKKRAERNKNIEMRAKLYGKWNPARSPYPPLECGFVIRKGDEVILVMRDSVVAGHGEDMKYYPAEFINHEAVLIKDAEVIVGQFPWTYP